MQEDTTVRMKYTGLCDSLAQAVPLRDEGVGVVLKVNLIDWPVVLSRNAWCVHVDLCCH